MQIMMKQGVLSYTKQQIHLQALIKLYVFSKIISIITEKVVTVRV